MTKVAPAREFARIINRMRNAADQIDEILPWEELKEGRYPENGKAAVLEEQLRVFFYLDHSLRRIFASQIGRGSVVLTGLSEENKRYYAEVIAPRRQTLVSAYLDFSIRDLLPLDVPDQTDTDSREDKTRKAEEPSLTEQSDTGAMGSIQLVHTSKVDPIRHIIQDGLSQIEEMLNEETGDGSQQLTLEDAKTIVGSPWFRPAEWISMFVELEPIKLSKSSSALEQRVRIRIYDLYQTLITGNYTAAIALSRSLIELALRDCARCWLVNRTERELRRHESGNGELSELLDQYRNDSVGLPLDDIIDKVQRPGNKVMHAPDWPKFRDPEVAETSVKCTASAVEQLYARRKLKE